MDSKPPSADRYEPNLGHSSMTGSNSDQDRELPRSACIECPFHNNMEWKWLKENDPKLFQNAVFTDKAIRKVPQLNGLITGLGYLHKDRKDLDTVDLSQTDDYDDFMTSECEWMCVVLQIGLFNRGFTQLPNILQAQYTMIDHQGLNFPNYSKLWCILRPPDTRPLIWPIVVHIRMNHKITHIDLCW